MSTDGPERPPQADGNNKPLQPDDLSGNQWIPNALLKQNAPSINDGFSELKTGAKSLGKGALLLLISILAFLIALVVQEEMKEQNDDKASSEDEDLPEIVETPGVLGGKPRIEGRRISVLDIAELLGNDYDIDQVAEELRIDPEEVLAAYHYWENNEDQIEKLWHERQKKHKELLEDSKRQPV